VEGLTGHSSAIFGRSLGYGAIFETARILDAFRTSLAAEELLTFNPSVMVGGSRVDYDAVERSGSAHGKTNVIPDRAVIEGDIRFISPEQLSSAQQRMRGIVEQGNLPRTSAEISFREGFPSMAPTPGNYALLALLDEVSQDLGYEPIEAHDPGRRGAADVSFVNHLVEGALDGLGAIGSREHAPDEFVHLDKLPMLMHRAALLIHRLSSFDRAAPLASD
jgi:glutamate carboxypeptidase